jgi:hypothetical protein
VAPDPTLAANAESSELINSSFVFLRVQAEKILYEQKGDKEYCKFYMSFPSGLLGRRARKDERDEEATRAHPPSLPALASAHHRTRVRVETSQRYLGRLLTCA